MKTKHRNLVSGILIGSLLGFYVGAAVAVHFDDFEENYVVYSFYILPVQAIMIAIAGALRKTKGNSEQNSAHIFQKPRAVSENGER